MIVCAHECLVGIPGCIYILHQYDGNFLTARILINENCEQRMLIKDKVCRRIKFFRACFICVGFSSAGCGGGVDGGLVFCSSRGMTYSGGLV